MYAKLALAFVLATSAAATPFGPAKTKNAAKAKYMNKLVRGAKPTKRSQLGRKLDGADEDYIPDISTYSLKFEQCQFVKAYDDEMADNEEAGTVLATKRFVVFKLCPTDSESCSYNYGEYLIDMETYLEAYVQYVQEQQEEFCKTCDEACEQEEEAEEEEAEEEDGGRRLDDANQYANYDCSCVETCEAIENMEENGYIDATEFLECQAIVDDDDGQLFAGPYCSGGEKIKIGVFSDENCMYIDSGKSVDDYLVDGDGVAIKLSYGLLKETYNADAPVSCLVVEEEDENANDDEDEKEPEIVELCEQLYEEAAKCEKIHGFDNEYADYAEYENQYAQEETVCDFISAVKSGTYTETGDINIYGGSSTVAGASGATGGQKFFLTVFILSTVGLAVYAAMLHTQLTKGDKADLSKQGGAMA